MTPGRSLQTPVCDLLEIRHPILNAGIGTAAVPELAAAVSNAGALGVLGGGTMPLEALAGRITRTRTLTDKPFGVNVIIAETEPGDREYLMQQIDAIAAMRVAAVVLFWGDPSPYVDIAHRHGAKVLIQVGSAEEARAAAAAGVDAVIAQGIEAGGHVRGTVSVWKLLPEVVEDLAPLPVLASGGPPRGQRPGEGTSIGTRTNVMGQRVEWMRYAVGSAPPDFDGDIEYAPLWAGESCSVVNDIKPAAEIVRDLVRGAETALAGA